MSTVIPGPTVSEVKSSSEEFKLYLNILSLILSWSLSTIIDVRCILFLRDVFFH